MEVASHRIVFYRLPDLRFLLDGCYYQEASTYEEMIYGEGKALQYTALTLRSAYQDGAAREGDRL